MEFIQKNIFTAREEAINQLNFYLNEHKEEYLQKAFELDNTNSNIIYYTLKKLELENKIKYQELRRKYKLFLNKEDAAKLNILYIDHKNDVLEILHSIQKMDPSKPEDIKILKDSLYKHYPKEDKNLLELEGKNRINNIPLNLNDDLIFFLKIKMKLGENLYNYAENLFKAIIKDEYQEKEKESEIIKKENQEKQSDDKEVVKDENQEKKSYGENEENKEEQIAIDFYKEQIPYLKVYTEILLFYIKKNDKKLVYCLLSKVDFTEINRGAIKQVCYYLKKMKVNFEEITKKTGFNFDKFIKYNFDNEEEIDKLPDNYQQLFFNMIEKILKSNCIKNLITKLATHHKDDKNIICIDDSYIKYIKENIIFHNFFDYNDYGFTNVVDGTILINTHYIYLENLKENEMQLFIFCMIIVTGIHEILGHFLKDYYYYSTKFYISDTSPIIDNIKEEGGELVEKYLFNRSNDDAELYICDVLYILDISNWEKNLDDFSSFFTSDLRKNLIKNGINYNSFSISKECIELLSNFNITKKNIIKIQSDIYYDFRSKNKNHSKFMKLSKVRCSNDKKPKSRFMLKNNY